MKYNTPACYVPEVSLQPGVDGEAASSGVHAGHILDIVHLLQCLLGAVVPVRVVQMLADQCVRLHCSICVHLRHVHIINEINEFLGARRPKVPSGFLLQRLLHDLLQHEGVGVVIEGDYSDKSLIFVEGTQLVTNQDSLATACIADQHDWTTVGHQQIQEVAVANCLRVVDKDSL